ncbi:hypothetical protein FZC74_13975 [Sutcliffiella horikoshii]|uniref:YunG n=1 Tax=Sutcliffiella horikoshii TaxID=79883 RepID=A0AA94WP16_9BACI|nr:hypothetical protein [Sutcliffiella horikoshii]TYS58096.1 hypothetical protein FZC74_13975 [Sutcliffiella horikoshii]
MNALIHKKMQEALIKSWSINSSSKWTEDNPGRGQCGVTALVVNDILGGIIRKTWLPEGWHFYNEIHGVRYDYTFSQFNEQIKYLDILSNREEAFMDTNQKQYDYLKQSVNLFLS